jgi:GT2 family glycosyltransferase
MKSEAEGLEPRRADSGNAAASSQRNALAAERVTDDSSPTALLSVVIPTHNKLPLLQRTLAALERQTLSPALREIVVVDDASSDGTAAWLQEYAADPGCRPRVVRAPRNLGRAAARNLGAEQARGAWLLFLDDDIIAPPTLLAAHRQLLAANPGWGVIGSVVTASELVDAPHFHYIDSRGIAKTRGDQVPARYFVTQNASLPRAAFLRVGGFDTGFSRYGFEDMELAFRLAEQAAVRFRPLRAPVPWHAHHHTLEQWLEKRRECGRSSLPRIVQLHPRRAVEMKLHWLLQPPRHTTGPLPRLARAGLPALARSPLWDGLYWAADHWPSRGPRHRPRLFPLYARLLDLLVFGAYARGLPAAAESGTG